MRNWTVAIAFVALLPTAVAGQVGNALPSKRDRGWRFLFDGKSTAGWSSQGTAQWRVVRGVLSGAGGDGWLRSEQQFTDFDLKFDFRNAPNWNSGVFLRATATTKPEERSNPVGGYELQIYNEDPKYATGSIEDYIQRSIAVNPAANRWHSFVVAVRGDHITAILDGRKILDGRDSTFRSGHVGLQHHSGMDTEFRRIKIRPILPSTP